MGRFCTLVLEEHRYLGLRSTRSTRALPSQHQRQVRG
jgi:hypothetical protein